VYVRRHKVLVPAGSGRYISSAHRLKGSLNSLVLHLIMVLLL